MLHDELVGRVARCEGRRVSVREGVGRVHIVAHSGRAHQWLLDDTTCDPTVFTVRVLASLSLNDGNSYNKGSERRVVLHHFDDPGRCR